MRKILFYLTLSLVLFVACTKEKPNHKKEDDAIAKITEKVKGLEFKKIKAGTFMMGKDGETSNSQYISHSVTLTKDFYLSKCEITRAQYCQFLNDICVPYYGTIKTRDFGVQTIVEDASFGIVYERGKWCTPADIYNDYPVTPSFYGALEFCRWAGGTLPTSAQWEYACRAGTTTTYFFGEDVSLLGEYAWYKANAGNNTHPVGQKKANPWGLYDMYGNVSEWCLDNVERYTSEAQTDPVGDVGEANRTTRGGSRRQEADKFSSYYYSTGLRTTNSIGFRLLIEVSK